MAAMFLTGRLGVALSLASAVTVALEAETSATELLPEAALGAAVVLAEAEAEAGP
jgi:hypothetical protein